MKKSIICALIAIFACNISLSAQNTFAGHYTRSLHDIMETVAQRWGVRFKYNVDTTGLRLPYADFRVRPYSLEETLTNICKYFDFNWWKQNGNLYKIKPYEYPRRHVEEGAKMLAYLSTLYSDRQQHEARRDSVRREVRARLGIDSMMAKLVPCKPVLGKKIVCDGYTVQSVTIETLPGEHVFGTIYTPHPDRVTRRRWSKAWGTTKYPLIICPDGHFSGGRFRPDEQQRLGTYARMGAICVDFDIYGWGLSEQEYGANSHQTDRAHVIQALNAEVLLNYMLDSHNDIDHRRIGVNGGSGGGSHTILLTVLDDRFTAAAPTVNLASHFDGGCPCESGRPIMLAGGGTCNPELLSFFAPKPLQVVSDGSDWTASVPSLEYPFLQRIYGFYDAKDKVENVHLPNERHDYGPNKRKANYDFFCRVFGLDRTRCDENKIKILSTNGHSRQALWMEKRTHTIHSPMRHQ